MKAMAYIVAVLAAVGIMIAIATVPGENDQAAATAEPKVTAASHRVMEEAGTLTISVPAMHCEFACYPKVKTTLEGAEAVTSVELDEQKEEGTIDNRQVVVAYEAGFDLDAALASLNAKGFKDSDLVE